MGSSSTTPNPSHPWGLVSFLWWGGKNSSQAESPRLSMLVARIRGLEHGGRARGLAAWQLCAAIATAVGFARGLPRGARGEGAWQGPCPWTPSGSSGCSACQWHPCHRLESFPVLHLLLSLLCPHLCSIPLSAPSPSLFLPRPCSFPSLLFPIPVPSHPCCFPALFLPCPCSFPSLLPSPSLLILASFLCPNTFGLCPRGPCCCSEGNLGSPPR